MGSDNSDESGIPWEHWRPDPSLLKLIKSAQAMYSDIKRQAAPMLTAMLSLEQDPNVLSLIKSAESAARELNRQYDDWKFFIETLPERDKEAFQTLSEHGWYLDPEMVHGDPIIFANEFRASSDRAAAATNTIVEHFRARLPEIELSLAQQFPERERFFRASFAAHARGEYCLSIPLLLIQTDGICADYAAGCFFLKENGAPKTAKLASKKAILPYEMAILWALTATMPINAGPKERAKFAQIPLNRHQVMHGESLDFDTEENSLRAISLLNYAAYAIATLQSKSD